MPPLFISSEFLATFRPPPLAEDAHYFAVAHSDYFGDNEDGRVGWIEDRTRVTDSPAIAVAWALALTGVADDGSNPLPLARIKAFSVNPIDAISDEEGDLPGEQIVIYVTDEGEVLSQSDPEFKAIDAKTMEWSEIIKFLDNTE
jgi:hypothetical protein